MFLQKKGPYKGVGLFPLGRIFVAENFPREVATLHLRQSSATAVQCCQVAVATAK